MYVTAQLRIFFNLRWAGGCVFKVRHLLIFDKFCGQRFAIGIGLPYIGLQ